MIEDAPAHVDCRRAWWVVAIPILGFVACRQGGLRPAGRDAAQTAGNVAMGGSSGSASGGAGGNIAGGGSGGSVSTGTGGFHMDVDAGGISNGGAGGRTTGGGSGGSISTATGGSPFNFSGTGGARPAGTGGGGGGQGGTVDAQIMLLPDGGCGSESPLWHAAARVAAPIGDCYRLDVASVDSGQLESGYVVVDAAGRVIYNSYFCNKQGTCDTKEMQQWLATLEGYRWPCLAGQTIHYLCRSA